MKKIYGIKQLEEELRQRLRVKGWALLDCRVDSFSLDAYRTRYGFDKAEKVAQTLEQIVTSVLDEMGLPEDVLCYESDVHYMIITSESEVQGMKEVMKTRFKTEMLGQYSLTDQKKGYILNNSNEKTPPVFLAIGIFLSSTPRTPIEDILNR